MHDFGEDFFVQTWLDGRMDDFRITLQVKGFQGKPGAKIPDPCSVKKVSFDRWKASLDLVVVVRWDVENRVGWYLLPSEVSADLPITRKGEVKLRFSPDRVFDVQGLQDLAWKGALPLYSPGYF